VGSAPKGADPTLYRESTKARDGIVGTALTVGCSLSMVWQEGW